MNKGAWWATVHGVTKSQTQLSDKHFVTVIMSSYIPGGLWHTFKVVSTVSQNSRTADQEKHTCRPF